MLNYQRVCQFTRGYPRPIGSTTSRKPDDNLLSLGAKPFFQRLHRNLGQWNVQIQRPMVIQWILIELKGN